MDEPVGSAPDSELRVSIGVVADNEPYTWVEGGRLRGFSMDVLDEVAQRSGVRFDYRAGSWPEIYPAFLRGEIDAIDEISFRADRAPLMLFTEPYHFRQTVIMEDGNRPIAELATLEDLKPYRVGIVRDIYFKSALVDRGVPVVEYDGLPNLIRALAFGWVDAIAGPEVTLRFLAHKAGLNSLRVAGKVGMDGLEIEDFRLAVARDKPELHRRLSEGLAAIPRERMAEIEEIWQEFGGRALEARAGSGLSDQQLDYVRRLGPLRVGVMRDYAPFSFVDGGKVQGLAVDTLTRVQDLTGMQIIPVTDRWTVLLDLFRRGEIDLIANISDSPDRHDFARFTRPYHVIPNVVFTRQRIRYERLEDLRGLRIALGSGIYYEAPLRAMFGDAVVSFSAQEPMFAALAQNSVDVVLAALPNGNHWVRTLGISDVRIAGELELEGYAGEDLRFAVRPALEPLRGIIDQALEMISPTERRTIESRWLGAAMGADEDETGSTNTEGIRFTAEEQAYLAAAGHTLRTCIDPEFMPVEGVDGNGRHTGMSADFLALFAARSDIRFEIVPTRNWSESLEAARARRCDLFPLAMMTPERSEFMDFTTPLYLSPNVVLARFEAPFIDSLDDLGSRPVGIVRGYAFAELLRTRFPHLQLVEVNNEVDGLRRLQAGSLHGYVSTLITAGYYMNEMGLADIKVIGRVPGDWTLAVATRSDHPVLHSIAQKLVDGIGDSDRREVEAKWRAVRLEQHVDYGLLWQILAGATVLFALLFLWNRKLGMLNRQLAEANARLEQYNMIDGLTEIGNRKYFDREYPAVFRWCQRHRLGFLVAMIDIDFFKAVNDTHGHAVGDECLKALAKCLRAHFRRETDRVARIGGEEFVVFASLDDERDACERLEDLREAVCMLRIPGAGREIGFTISIGVCVKPAGESSTPEGCLKLADDALYQAKREGRNRCVRVSANPTG